MKRKHLNIFLDSGAFSAFHQRDPINVEDYAAFLDEFADEVDVIASLDVIPVTLQPDDVESAVEQGFQNALYLRERGHDVLPTVHKRENVEVLYRYLDAGFTYIGISGSTDKHGRLDWLERMFEDYLTDGAGRPLADYHGFALSGPGARDYPWRSTDSMAGIITAGTRKVFIPRVLSNGEYDYISGKREVIFSNRINSKKKGMSAVLVEDDKQGERRALTVDGVNKLLRRFYGVELTVEPNEVNTVTMYSLSDIYLQRMTEQINRGIPKKGRRIRKAENLLGGYTDGRRGVKVKKYTYFACVGYNQMRRIAALNAVKQKDRLVSFYELRDFFVKGDLEKCRFRLRTGLKDEFSFDRFPLQYERV